MKSLKQFALAVALTLSVVSLNSCKSNEDAVTPTTQATQQIANNYRSMKSSLPSLDNTKWEFVNYAIATTTIENKATIQFTKTSDNSLEYSGRSFINNYFGTLKLDESKGLVVSKSPMASTLMAGGDVEMQQEFTFQNSLDKATYFEIKNNQLMIYLGDQTDAKTEIMIFDKK